MGRDAASEGVLGKLVGDMAESLLFLLTRYQTRESL